MKFLVDAQLPRKLSDWLTSKGFDSIHTLDLPLKNYTSDQEISQISLKEKRIVISKDADFFNSYFQKLEPHKLLFLTVGNISTKQLIALFEKNMDNIIIEINHYNVVQISSTSIIVID